MDEQQDQLGEIYSLIVAIDQLEKAYIRDAVTPKAYTEACQRLLAQYTTLLRNPAIEAEFGDLESFCARYKVQASNGVSRINVRVPATVELAQASHPEPHLDDEPAVQKYSPQAVVEATGNFITTMDGLKLNFRAKDQLHPLFSELVTSLNKVTRQDFDGRGKLVQWLVTLNKLKINDELSDEQVRQCLFDLEQAYKSFYAVLK